MKLSSSDFEGVEARGSSPAFIPSEQQAAVFDWILTGSGSAIVVAVAGAGKTTTLRKGCSLMEGSVAFCAYNKKIADDIAYKLKLDGVGSNVSASTFHSYGYRAWKSLFPKCEMGSRDKMDRVMKTAGVPEKMMNLVSKLVSLAKNNALGVEGGWGRIEDDNAWLRICEHFGVFEEGVDSNMGEDEFRAFIVSKARECLTFSNLMLETCTDFDDMIYAPIFRRGGLKKNNYVLIDEAQDSNPARRIMAREMLYDDGRLIAIGDPRQAIYGFTGASADALDIIKRDFQCIELPLTITYRCPKRVVRHAQQWVSHITAADSAPEGTYESLKEADFRKRFKNRESLTGDAAILCRYTKPLVKLAFELIRADIPCHVEGKEIGRGLVSLCRKWKVSTCKDLTIRLENYLRNEHEKADRQNNPAAYEAVADRVETIFVIMEALDDNASVWQLTQKIESLFGDTPEGGKSRDLTLSTVHKAKGREWPTVFVWGRSTMMPSKYAKQEWQIEQENNLIYVAVTRAMERLYEVEVE